LVGGGGLDGVRREMEDEGVIGGGGLSFLLRCKRGIVERWISEGQEF